MSTIDSIWLNRSLDSDYFWDNVLRPTRFSDVVQNVAHDEGDNVVLLEIATHPAMKTCVSQCGVRYVGLIQRPAPDASVDGSKEYLQLLEAAQHLCDAGFPAGGAGVNSSIPSCHSICCSTIHGD